MRKLLRSLLAAFGYDIVRNPRRFFSAPPKTLTFRELEAVLAEVRDPEQRESVFKAYQLNPETGDFVLRSLSSANQQGMHDILSSISIPAASAGLESGKQKYRLTEKIHYGCGTTFLKDWLNVDSTNFEDVYRAFEAANPGLNYAQADLTTKHLFPSDYFRLGYSEDFIEHLGQAESLIFLSECYRTFQKGGIFRLSFPGLEGVLKRHYRETGYRGSYPGKIEAYTLWDHVHFYSREEIRLCAIHAGFSKVEFAEFGRSHHAELQNLDMRAHQKDLNTYVELTK